MRADIILNGLTETVGYKIQECECSKGLGKHKHRFFFRSFARSQDSLGKRWPSLGLEKGPNLLIPSELGVDDPQPPQPGLTVTCQSSVGVHFHPFS